MYTADKADIKEISIESFTGLSAITGGSDKQNAFGQTRRAMAIAAACFVVNNQIKKGNQAWRNRQDDDFRTVTSEYKKQAGAAVVAELKKSNDACYWIDGYTNRIIQNAVMAVGKVY